MWPTSLETALEWTQLRILVIKIFIESNHFLNLAKCHTPVFPGVLRFNFTKLSWPRRLSLLFLQEDELQM